MSKISRHNFIDIFLILVFVVLTALVAEGAYRVYLKFQIEKTVVQNVGNRKKSVISFMNDKGAWKFDKEVGFNFRPNGYLAGQIVENAFKNCGQVKHFNSRGNIASRKSDYLEADVRGALIGSSYTMGRSKDGRLFHEILSDNLTKKTGKKIVIENYSRDRYGVIQMMDMAAKVATSEKPNFIIIAFNSATIGMPRLWRVVESDRKGFYNFIWVNEPVQTNLTTKNSKVHRYVLYDKVTSDWCAKMKKALQENRKEILRNDPVILAMIQRYQKYNQKNLMPAMNVNFRTLTTSFLFNRLFRRNAFWNMGIYQTKNNPLAGLEINDYGDDKRFLESVRLLKETKIPFYLVHIPEYPELRTGNEWESIGSSPLPVQRGLSLVASLEKRLNQKILSFLPSIKNNNYDIETLPRKMAPPNMDWHPSDIGVSVYSNILSDILKKKIPMPRE